MECRELVSVAELTSSERLAFVNAVLALKAAPSRIAAAAAAVTAGAGTPNRYDDYVWMHSTVGAGAHFGPAFGPWHREFLRQFEFDLRLVSGDPHVVIPYWDWTTGQSAGSPNWPFTDDLMGPLGDASGLVTSGPFSNPATFRMNIRRQVFREDNAAQVADNNLQLRRRPASVAAGFSLPSGAVARGGTAQSTPFDVAPYNELPALEALINGGASNAQLNAQINAWTSASFRKYLEWRLHNGPHTWVGGDDDWASGPSPLFIAGPMSIPAVSPNDPIFWLHHCNVDRLWTTWQQRHTPGAYAPSSGAAAGHNLNDELVHFEAANAGNFNTAPKSRPTDVVDSRVQLNSWYTSDLPLITLVTPSVDLGDVPANLTTDWPVRFDVRTCRPVKFRVTAVGGANFRVPPAQGDVIANHDHAIDPVRANVFIEFEALGAANVVQSGSATIAAFIDDSEGYYTGSVGAEFQVGSFNVTFSARPVPPERAAITLVLDRSGSMAESAGPLGTKYDLLRSSLRVVAAILRDDDAIGLISYDDLVATLTPAVLAMGTRTPPGAGRQAIESAIVTGELLPRGATAIGQGMLAGATLLQTVQSDPTYAVKAMVVMTDGNENVAPSVTDPAVTSALAWFSSAVYAIGLGAPTNVSATTLGAIARYQLITGTITSNEQRFLLTKYFLQILAHITAMAIVVDPQGELRPGDVHRIPFDIGDSDVSMDVIALCPIALLLDLQLEAPDGTILQGGSTPNATLQIDAGDEIFRVMLPAVPGNASGTHAGRWHAILTIRNRAHLATASHVKAQSRFEGIDQTDLAAVVARGALPYQLFVQSYSNLRLEVELEQTGFLPGSRLAFRARLHEYRQPVAAGSAHVFVDLVEPAVGELRIALSEVAPGRFEGEQIATSQGIYQCRFRAYGVTRKGSPFQREETRTAAIGVRLVPGGDSATTPPRTERDDERWCALMACLLREPSIVRLLEKHEVEPREIAACLKRYCTHETGRGSAGLTHVLAKEVTMSSRETDQLRAELLKLRAELHRRDLFDGLQLEGLLTPSPASKPVALPPQPLSSPAATGAHAHHMRALPALVEDEQGNVMVLIPSGHGRPPSGGGGGHGGGGHQHGEGGHGSAEEPAGGEQDQGAGHGGHGHADHDHRGHEHARPPPKKKL